MIVGSHNPGSPASKNKVHFLNLLFAFSFLLVELRLSTKTCDLDFLINAITNGSRQRIGKRVTKNIGSASFQKKAEETARQVCLIQNTSRPKLNSPAIIVFAGDHGFAGEELKLSQEPTRKAAAALINGAASLNLFAQKKGIGIKVVDAGVNHRFFPSPTLIDAKIRMGSKNFLKGPAMNLQECRMAMEMAASIVDDFHSEGVNVLGFSEIGVGNEVSAALIMHQLTRLPVEECLAEFFYHDDSRSVFHMLDRAKAVNPVERNDPMQVLAAFGGYEIAMMTGGMLRAAELRTVILVDGFVSSVALLVASSLYPEILDYCIFTHLSHEKGHAALLEYLGGRPLLSSQIFSSEGAGAALAIGILQTVVELIPGNGG